MNRKQEFDSLQKRIVGLLAVLESTRYLACQNGERFFQADLFVNLAYENVLNAVKRLRDETRKNDPSISEDDFGKFMLYVEWIASEKELPVACIFNGLISAAQALVDQAEANHKTALRQLALNETMRRFVQIEL